MYKDFKKRFYSFVSFFLILILLLGCQATTEKFPVVGTETKERVKDSTPEPSFETKPAITPTPRPTISLDYKTLRGLTINVLHPFTENEEIFNQMVRDFNLNNIWGLHVVPIAYPGYQALSQSLQSETLEADLVIGMSKYLQAAGSSEDWMDLGDFANDPKYGVQDLYEPDGVFADLLPDFDSESLNELPLAYNAGLIYFNTAWAEALGEQTIPSDRESLRAIANKAMVFNANDDNYWNNGTGGLWLSQSSFAAISWYVSFGGELGDPRFGFLPEREVMMSAFNFLKSLYQADESWIGIEADAYRYFSNRYAVAYEGDLNDFRFTSAYQNSGQYKDEWTTLPYFDAQGNAFLVLDPLSFAISRTNEKNQLAAWLFGRWLLEPDQQERLVEIHGFWPATGDPAKLAPEFAKANPAWVASLQNKPGLTLVPSSPVWAQTELVFQDAFQRIYNLDSQYFPSILDVFEEMMRINLEQAP